MTTSRPVDIPTWWSLIKWRQDALNSLIVSSCGKGNTLLLLREATVNQREEGSLEQADVFSASQSFGMDGCGGGTARIIWVCLNKSVRSNLEKECFMEVLFLFRLQQPDAKDICMDGSGFNCIGRCSGNGWLISAHPLVLHLLYIFLFHFFLFVSSPSPPNWVFAGAWCNFQLVQCVTHRLKKKRTGDPSPSTGRFTMVSSSHSSSRGPLRPPFLLAVLNEHMLQISQGREEGKRGRKSKRTDTRGGNFRDFCEVWGMSALLGSQRP